MEGSVAPSLQAIELAKLVSSVQLSPPYEYKEREYRVRLCTHLTN